MKAPPRIRIALVFGDYWQLAWSFLAFLMIAPAFGGHTVHFDFITFASGTEVTKGVVIDIEEHEYRTSRGRFTPPTTHYRYEHTYEFEVSNIYYQDVCHSSQRKDGEVRVQYVIDNPEDSRIVGMSTGVQSGLFAMFVQLAYLTLLGCSFWRMRKADILARRCFDRLHRLPPYRSVGWFPKIRLNDEGEFVARGCIGLLFVPIICTALSLLMTFTIKTP